MKSRLVEHLCMCVVDDSVAVSADDFIRAFALDVLVVLTVELDVLLPVGLIQRGEEAGQTAVEQLLVIGGVPYLYDVVCLSVFI